MFANGPEYESRRARPFTPPTVTLKQIHDAVPKHLLRKDVLRSSGYVARDVFFCALFFAFAASIEPMLVSGFGGYLPLKAAWQIAIARAALWATYWWWQGLCLAGFFCLAHWTMFPQLGHGTMFDSRLVNDTLGFLLHTFILAPFFAWKVTHNAHHKAVGSLERDENYVPYTRGDYKLPPKERASRADYSELLDETPFLTLLRMFVMQAFGWWVYLSYNVMGSKMYPPGTNHFSPYSALFKKEQRRGIIVSDIGISVMLSLLVYAGHLLGWKAVVMYYVVPYIVCNHWLMSTYLHHSDPTIPHFYKEEWSFLRGAAATVDRPLLGWAGRFFLHNVSHDHVAHHFFSYAPFYNQPEITKAIRTVLKDDYNYDSTNTFYALYRSFTECVFVEEEGGIVFYKNKYGESVREVAETAFGKLKEAEWNADEQDQPDVAVEKNDGGLLEEKTESA
ncbi:fatty acid desaturase-domain-containing protein [Amylocystis lapponica]|nr:fatty acid desaturase-domain-containing protein [Amylocystis lapponica]